MAIEWSIKSLAKMFMGALVFIMLIGALWLFWGVFFAEERDPAIDTLARVKAELEAAQSPGCIQVPTQGTNYLLSLYPPENKVKACATKACICLEREKTRCQVLKGIKKNCDRGLCIKTETNAPVLWPAGNPVQVCHKGKNELSISRIS